MLLDAKSLGNQTKIKARKTETGTKDTYLEFFIERLSSSYANVKSRNLRQQALDNMGNSLPEKTFSPVWRIRGLDPHSDTPVEILHVILLGFVKYFWRDVVQNQVKKNSAQRELLITRLESVDVAGIPGVSKLAGKTLVDYAGSLTGRDFRAIAQVAPFVLYDLVPPACYHAWVSLSNLIPLIWQPIIPDIEKHLVRMYE